jgi:hypothetical protein
MPRLVVRRALSDCSTIGGWRRASIRKISTSSSFGHMGSRVFFMTRILIVAAVNCSRFFFGATDYHGHDMIHPDQWSPSTHRDRIEFYLRRLDNDHASIPKLAEDWTGDELMALAGACLASLLSQRLTGPAVDDAVVHELLAGIEWTARRALDIFYGEFDERDPVQGVPVRP